MTRKIISASFAVSACLFQILTITAARAEAVFSGASGSWTEFAQATNDTEQRIIAQYPNISRVALDRAFNYLALNPNLVINQNYMTVIDFDLPSTRERMYVIDLKNITVKSYLVAHGKESGDIYATRFSNEINSDMSSIGIYLTAEPYIGEHGLSLKLQGKEATNSNAEAREIVLHGADYVSPQSIQQLGRLGRSLGCPAVGPQYSSELVKELQNGSIFLIYKSN